MAVYLDSVSNAWIFNMKNQISTWQLQTKVWFSHAMVPFDLP